MIRNKPYFTEGLMVFEIVKDPVVALENTAADKSDHVKPLSTLPCNLKVFAEPFESDQLNNSNLTPLIAILPSTLGLNLNSSLPTQF